MKLLLITVTLLLMLLNSLSAFALERSCYGRIYALHLRTGYQIDLVNHISAKAYDINASDARYQASDNIWYCARDWWYARNLLIGVNKTSALPPSCRNPANGNVYNLQPGQVDILQRIKTLACNMYRPLVDANDFHVAIYLETYGDDKCGLPKQYHFLLDPIFILPKETCAPLRIR